MSYRPCPQCKVWGDCRGYDQFTLEDIQYCRYQILWLIAGETEFDHDDSPGSHSVKPHAAFVPQSDILAELGYRLSKTGKAGETLEHEIRVLHVYTYRMLSPTARDAVNYVAGRKRKRQTFAQWLRDRRAIRKNDDDKLPSGTA